MKSVASIFPPLMVVRYMTFSLFLVMCVEHPLSKNQRSLNCLPYTYEKNNHSLNDSTQVILGLAELVKCSEAVEVLGT